MTNAECFYFDRDKDYRWAVYDWLRGNGNLPLRRMDTTEGSPTGIGADMTAKARAKGYVFPIRKKVKRKEVALA